MSAAGDVATGPGWELRCGDYREALADVKSVDAVITDPPYSERTHAGHASGANAANEVARLAQGAGSATSAERRYAARLLAGGGTRRREIDYRHWTAADVRAFVERWGGVDGWIVALASDDMHPWYRAAYEAVGRYATHQLPCCIRGMTVRMCGDGPSSWAVYAQPSRPRWRNPWGTLDGFYAGSAEKCPVVGGKPLWLMRALIRDYTRPGDLVCDPCAGGGTTLLAAVIEGRRAIGAELDPETFDKAVARLKRGYTPSMEALWAEGGDSAAE